jgi:hypothetical protein
MVVEMGSRKAGRLEYLKDKNMVVMTVFLKVVSTVVMTVDYLAVEMVVYLAFQMAVYLVV